MKGGKLLECYKEFAHIYDKLLHGDIEYIKWANIIMKICDEFQVNREDFLDLACGTGNITRELGKFFKNIWAVDISGEMLSEAESKLREDKLKAKFICQDISSLKLKNKFDLITCILDSTNYILEAEKLKDYFKGVYNHLKEGGLFVFDINSYYKLTEILGNNIYNYDDEEIVYIWENLLEEEVVSMYLTFFVKEEDKYRRFDEEHRERAYKEEFIDKILRELGFKILKKLDNYISDNIKETTERIVYVVQK